MNKNKKISFQKFLSKFSTLDFEKDIKKHIKTYLFNKNQNIFSQGDKVTGVYFINYGNVKVLSKYDSENYRILRLSSSGDFLGHRALNLSAYSITATTLTDAEITFIPINFFRELLQKNADFSTYIINFLLNELMNAEERMKSIIHHEVIIRIAVILCMLVDAFGFDENIPKKLHYTLPRKDFADFAGTTYESIIRNLAMLEELKIIKLDNKSIHILNEKKLRNLIVNG